MPQLTFAGAKAAAPTSARSSRYLNHCAGWSAEPAGNSPPRRQSRSSRRARVRSHWVRSWARSSAQRRATCSPLTGSIRRRLDPPRRLPRSCLRWPAPSASGRRTRIRPTPLAATRCCRFQSRPPPQPAGPVPRCPAPKSAGTIAVRGAGGRSCGSGVAVHFRNPSVKTKLQSDQGHDDPSPLVRSSGRRPFLESPRPFIAASVEESGRLDLCLGRS